MVNTCWFVFMALGVLGLVFNSMPLVVAAGGFAIVAVYVTYAKYARGSK